MPVPRTSRHLLRLLAETFEFELEQERQLQLKGAGTLPPEWTAYLKRERQEILNKIQQMELLEEHSTPPSDTTQVSPQTVPSAHVRHDNAVHHGGGTHRAVSESIGGPGSSLAGPSRPQDGVYPSNPSQTETNVHSPSRATISGGSLRSTSPTPSSTIHHHADATGHDRERVHQTPSSVLGCSCVTRGIEQERAGHQPRAAMFDGAQSATIHGGVFVIVQGGVSHMSPA